MVIYDYETEIKQYHHALVDYPDNTIILNKLNYRLTKWAEQVDIVFYGANNEQKGYTTDNVGYPVLPMPTKKESSFRQTSDYLCYLPQYKKITGVLWERKSKEDWYNTIIHDSERFYNECRRSQNDPDCHIMIVGVESTAQHFLTYRPRGKQGATLQSRHALCESLSPKFGYKIVIRWHNGRKATIEDMIKQNRMWIKYNYKSILKLE